MNSHNWKEMESKHAYNKVLHVIDLLNQNFGVGSSVHLGIIYLAVGGNGGRLTSRYLLLLPYYSPSISGYCFSIQHPYIFARGFAETVSLDFYAWLDREWTKAVTDSNNNSELMECSPIMLYTFDVTENAEFQPFAWNKTQISQGNMIFTNDTNVECWIHGPTETHRMENHILEHLKVDNKTKFMCLLNLGEEGKLQELMENLVQTSNNFSFPTIKIKINSPMMGLVPFDVKPIYLQIGGGNTAGDHETNDLHIPVINPILASRRISFQRLWNVLYDPCSLTINPKLAKAMCKKIRKVLEC